MSAVTTTPYVARLVKLEAETAELRVLVTQQQAILAAIGAAFGVSGDGGAKDRELDSQHGDPEVRLVPRDWTAGGVVKGQKFSRCPAAFLDLLAETYDYFATKNDADGAKDGKGRPKSTWDKKNARLARGWARRIRDGWTPPAKPPAPTFGSNGASNGLTNGAPINPYANGGGGFLKPPAPTLGPGQMYSDGRDSSLGDAYEPDDAPVEAGVPRSTNEDFDDDEEAPL